MALLPMAMFAKDLAKEVAVPAILLIKPNFGKGVHMERDLSVVLKELKAAEAKSKARGDTFSRVCRGCGVEHPLRRAVSITCGHAVCHSCTIEKDNCLVCYEPASFVELPECDDYSRRCGVCGTSNPLQRVLLSACGHTICGVCAIQRIPDALSEDAIFCPYCSYDSPVIFLAEDVITPSIFSRFARFVIKIIRKIFY